MLGIDSSNSFPDHAMFGRLEDGSWFTWKMHQFTLAKHTLATYMIPTKPYTRTAFVAVRAVGLATDSKTAPVNGSTIRPCFSVQRAGSHLPVG